MQQDKNDIGNKLRQLENQQLPDLSQMDGHWESMKAALQPVPAKESSSNKWLWLMALLLIVGSVILVINYNNAIKKNEPLEKQTNTVAEIKPDLKATDSATTSIIPVSKMASNKMLIASVPVKTAKNKISKNETGKNVMNLPVRLNPEDSTLTAVNPDAQKILNKLLASLAKKAEEFLIDNSRDTILFAAEGSSLYIPAKSLGGSKRVKISLREFYKTSDIVMNKLNTTSNGEQLVSGGMVHISATVNDKPVDVFPGKPIKWYIPDTSKQMGEMQLFEGEEKKTGVNWISTRQKFNGPSNITEVRVLDVRNEPIRTFERRNGTVAVFCITQKPELSRSELRDLLKEKYGYSKVRLRRQWKRDRWVSDIFSRSNVFTSVIGDSAWVKKEVADRYNLQATQTRIMQGESSWGNLFGGSILNFGIRKARVKRSGNIDTLGVSNKDTLTYDSQSDAFRKGLDKLEEKYSVDISKLGWINCDRFYNDRCEKVDYYVDLQDSAINYYTMLVFNKFRSMMAGYVAGNNVHFTNVPMGESVKIISIGIDKKGEAVMAMKETKIGKETFTGLLFESTSDSVIKSTLRKEDSDK